MAEWGIYGIVDGTAGTFLTQHFSTLGPYFGDMDPYNWPHSPFVNEPTQLELKFNEKMIQMTEIMSNGSLQDVSILDLSAFGSTISWLNRNHKRESSWPIEMNFEVLKRCKGSCQTMVEEYTYSPNCSSSLTNTNGCKAVKLLWQMRQNISL